MIKTTFLIIGIAIISIGFIPLFEYGSEWPELDQAPNVQLYPYVALVFFVIAARKAALVKAYFRIENHHWNFLLSDIYAAAPFTYA